MCNIGGNVTTEVWIQDSGFRFETGLDSRFKFESQKNEIQDSDFVFKGPIRLWCYYVLEESYIVPGSPPWLDFMCFQSTADSL